MTQKQKRQNKAEARNAIKVSFTPIGWEDFVYWQSADAKVLGRVLSLIDECCRSPFKGTGKPEPLKGDLTGYWSRRINKEHRFVYYYETGALTVLACRFNY
ncbi:Txe/YoeB family addiction module toxin [Pseudomonas sp. CAM1A]|uniref:Txe/YoeB family addiction module toxin n=1 Tax=Pseudomonas sp. CAM1A TaxID=3231717 RepID=UPI0039C63ED1